MKKVKFTWPEDVLLDDTALQTPAAGEETLFSQIEETHDQPVAPVGLYQSV